MIGSSRLSCSLGLEMIAAGLMYCMAKFKGLYLSVLGSKFLVMPFLYKTLIT